MIKTEQIIAKKFKFDAAHRIVNHCDKCGNVHGHEWHGELIFKFSQDEMEDKDLGYSMDFTEIKRIGLAFIDDYFDHAYIANPIDYMVDVCTSHNSKLWIMGLNSEKSCNPSVENIAKELFMIMNILFVGRGIMIDKVRLYETESSYTEVEVSSISLDEMLSFHDANEEMIVKYLNLKGKKSYDITKQ